MLKWILMEISSQSIEGKQVRVLDVLHRADGDVGGDRSVSPIVDCAHLRLPHLRTPNWGISQ